MQESVGGIRKIARHLVHPLTFRFRDDPGNSNFRGRQTNHEQNVVANQTRRSPHLSGEEVGGRYDIPMNS